MKSGGIERIAWPLTGSVCSFIVRSIPEGLMFREFSSIWEIPIKTKGEIALELIDAGIAAAVPTEVVLADAGYGDQPRFLDGPGDPRTPLSGRRSLHYSLPSGPGCGRGLRRTTSPAVPGPR